MGETIGFSGTRDLHPADVSVIVDILDSLPRGTTIVTGACTGVDAAVTRYAMELKRFTVHTIVPSDRSHVDREWEKYCHTFDEMPEGTTYRDRNLAIVEICDRLIAIPAHAEDAPESKRSGTWQTIRLARKAEKPVKIWILCDVCQFKDEEEDELS